MNTKIRIKQPWATLVCSGILRHVELDSRPERIPGLYSVHSVYPSKEEEIPKFVMQEIVNHTLFGNINPLHLPYGGHIGMVSIVGCREVDRCGTVAYDCTIGDSFEMLYSLEGVNYGSGNSVRFPKLSDGVLVIPLSRKNFMTLKVGESIEIELTDSFRELVFDSRGRMRNVEHMLCYYADCHRVFSVKIKRVVEKRSLTESLCFTLISEFSK